MLGIFTGCIDGAFPAEVSGRRYACSMIATRACAKPAQRTRGCRVHGFDRLRSEELEYLPRGWERWGSMILRCSWLDDVYDRPLGCWERWTFPGALHQPAEPLIDYYHRMDRQRRRSKHPTRGIHSASTDCPGH